MTRQGKAARPHSPRGFDGELEELEPRILFSADLFGLLPGDASAASDAAPTAQVALLPATPADQQGTQDAAQLGQASMAASAARVELVFVDAGVPDGEQLVAFLQAQNDAGRTLEIHWIDAHEDGIAQITEILKGRQDIDALHIISHGDGAGLQLGNDRLDSAGLYLHMGQLASWAGALSAEADLLLYGCDLASTGAGQALVDDLALLTGADVAASADATGSALKGGNWTLEYQGGSIETQVAMSTAGQATWQHVLALTATGTSESLVNGTTTGTQRNDLDSGKQVAADGSGNYVVVWEDVGSTDVYGRLYNADGTPRSGEFRINTNTATAKDEPTVAMDTNGNFVVAWRSVTQDGSGYGIYAQRYNASGVAQGSEFRVNTTTASEQNYPAIAMSTTGFVITWSSLSQDGDNYGVYAQRYNASGVAQGSEFRVNTTTANIQKNSQIGMDASGNFVIAWQSYAQDGAAYGVFAQRYNASGVAQGSEFQVNVTTTGEQILSDVSMNATGSFVIVWHDSSGVDGSGYGVFARTYNSSGVAQTGEFVLSTYIYTTQWNASVVMGDDGSFVATWASLTVDGFSYGISVRQFSLAGIALSPETIVNTTQASDQLLPSVAWGGHRVIITWSGNGSADNLGVYARLYDTLAPAVVSSVGTETRANTTTTAPQQTNASAGKQVATAANGNFVVVWEDTTTDYVYARLYNAAGTALTGEFQVNTDTTAARNKDQPTVAMDDAGNFVIAWHSQLQDGAGYGIYAQRYNASAVAQGSEFRVNTYTTSDQESPAIAMSASGFVITWTSYLQDGSVEGVYAQRYNASGVAQGSEFRVNTTTANIQKDSRIGMDDSGNFIIAWSGSGQDGSGYGVFAQRYNASGVAQGSEFRVNVTTAGEQLVTDVSMNGSGSFVISWDASAADAGGYATFARTYNASGTALSGDIQLNNFELGEQRNSSVSMSDTGDFVAVFEGGLQDGYVNAIAMRMFSQTGVEIMADHIVNTTQSGGQETPSVSWNGAYLVVSWSGNGTGDSAGVFFQRYVGNLPPEITSNGGGGTASVNVAENTAAVTTVTATDSVDQTLVYSIAGGADAARFTINSSTGVLSFVGAPNYEAPSDVGADNVYDVIVQVSDGAYTDTQTLTVTVTDEDEFNVGAVSDTNAAANAVAENATNGTVVGITAYATDADGTNNTITYSLSDNAGGRFTINASTGVVTVANGTLLNYEAATSHAITVVASSADGSSNSQVMAISLSDVDEFDVGAVSDTNAAANTVAENAVNGTVVGITAFATDADGTNNTITYSLSDNAGGRFTINASTGVVTVASGTFLNYEAATSHAITVVATSADGSSSNQVMTINLSDVDEFDVGAVSDANAAANTVAENATNGTVVGITAYATDADGTNNTIAYSLSDNAGGRFTINASTGVVTVADGTLLNYEATTSHAITVIATSSDGSSSNQAMTINLSDVDEFDVGTVSDTNAAANTVAENAVNGTVVGITAYATDADGTNNTITYSLSDNAGGRFAINASTGVVTVANGTLLNYEAATSHAITVVATSADASTSSQVMTINLSDVDEFDVGAVSDTNAAGNTVAENATNGTVVGITAYATDADGTTNTITYSLSDTAGGRFTINTSTGVVTVADGTLLNYEAATSHAITVVATSLDGSSSNQVMTINLSDVDEFDVGAISDANAAANTVAENATNGTVVGITAYATDADGTNNTITYSLSDNAGGRFTINTSTGVVTVADGTLLNYEAATSHAITVVATSADGSSSNQVMNINLSDVDEFDVGAVSDTNATANTVAENATNGTVVGITAYATDADGTNHTITYSLSDDAAGRFTIDASTGVITVADGTLLNYEAATSHAITVVATSADGSSSNQVMTINLSDVDEFDVGAVSDANAAANTVPENAVNGTTVGITAYATDADGTNNTITYSLSDNAAGRFTIDASTGIVTVADGTLLNYEAATSHAITVLATSADGSTSNQVMTINLSDVDEFDVGAVSDTNAAANTVTENATSGTVVGITAYANDADGTNNTITYSLSDDAAGRFTIDASTGVITVANGTLLDYEAATSHAITVVATSSDGSSSNQVMTINLSDVDEFDVGAVSDTNAAANNVAENAVNGTTVGITAYATDADGTNTTITYSLSDNAGGRFTINASTGVVTVADGTLLNYEAATSHAITVVATSADGSSSNQVMTINLSDVDEFDVGAVSDTNAAANTVAENAVNGTTVGITAYATDADGTNNNITYSLSDNAGGRFTINASTGVVTVADGTLLDYEAATTHAITVVATSADGSSSNQVMTINLSDVDEFDVSAVSDTNAAANTVAENAVNGTTVGITAYATDADSTNNTITYSLSDSAGGRFTINANTGVVTVANGTLLNYEAATSHAVTVVANSADGSSSNQVMTINLSDVDEFDVGAVSDTNAAANSVAENATNGTVVGVTAYAADADGTNSTITYSLSDDAAGRFTIDASTGVVTVADGTLLDYEAATSHAITVVATSSDGSSSNQVMAINLSDVDEFDVGVVSDTNAAANSVAENATNGTVVGVTAYAADADGTNSTITYSLSDDAAGRFTIDASTGVVTVADGTLLDYEAATSHAITVVATSSDGSSSNQVMTINLSDADEFDVGAVSDTNAAANTVAENAVNGTTVGITAYATDADGTNNTITYSLSDNAAGRFTIDASTGVVTVADGTLLDYEAATSHAITVVATSSDGSSSNQVMTINLSDVDEFDVGAVSDANAAANTVSENAVNGTTVGITAYATDADGTNNTITYSLSDDAAGRFTIDATTGVVTVANGTLLNYEAATSHAVTVVATSTDGSSNSQVMTINLSDVDEFDVGAVSDTNATANTVAENVTNGTAVGITAYAADADGTNNTITYSLSDNAGGRFTINTSTGVVTVADDTLLDYEAATSHAITVVATSSDGSSSNQVMTINLSDVDEFDVGAVSDTNAAANSVAENATNGTVVGVTAYAADADGTNSTITYSLSDDAAGRFTIDASTGVVTVANGTLLDYEAATSHAITVVATSLDGSSNSQVMTINLSDVDEFDVGAVSDTNAGANTVAENAVNGTVVGITAYATDADGTNNTITYSLSDDAAGRFTIDVSTGVVTVANGTLLDYEAATSHAITVVAASADGSSNSEVMTINLSDVDEFDVGAVSDTNAASNIVAENATNGTVVGITAYATDTDGTNNTITYSLSNDAGGRFTINASTGVVTVADGTLLNYEADTSHAITIVATSLDGSSSSQAVTINLSDVNELPVSAVTDTNAAANTVAEDAANGTAVGITAHASDADGSNNNITYSLSDDAGGRFAIDAVTGVVTVVDGSLLDYASDTTHAITVVATSADGSSSTQAMVINVLDANAFPVGAVTDADASGNSVAENAAGGTVVGITAQASDADGDLVTYALSDDAGGRFTIDANTGVVTVADGTLLNYEATASHAITVVATSSDGSSSIQVMTIQVADVNEFPVDAVSDINPAANTVAENAANGSVVGITVLATDADGTNNAISYSLSDDADGRFTIDASTGVVTVADGSLLDFEAAASHAITVVATSVDGSSSSQVMTVNLSDVNEFAVGSVTDSNAAANTVFENAANGSLVGITAQASDQDGTTNAITHSLSDDAGGRFAIDAITGAVTVANGTLLDFEAATSHAITVVATSADGSSSSQVMTITLSDVNEFALGAVSDTNAAANAVLENAANGTAVGITASATDADATTNAVSYSLSDNAGGRFTINAVTGVVTVANGTLLNYEAATSHAITVLATSADGSSSSQVMTITVSDVNEFPVSVVTDANASPNTVVENAANGSMVSITATATDADGSQNAITYSLSDDAGGRFTIDASTGVVTVSNGTLLDFESAASHAVTVVATSADGSSSSQVMTITLSDVDEFDVGAVSDTNAAANTVAENAVNGTTVGITAYATDADGTNNTITYSLSDNAGGRFAINASTGVVTVADSTLLNYEAATSHAITVLATSTDGSSSGQVMTINLSDVDEFDVGAVSDTNAAANTVAENAVNGTTVGITAYATDADGTNNTITYSLSDNAGGRFAINASTGVVTVADSTLLNYEAATSHAITVLATSTDGSSSGQVMTINLSDVDEFDVGAVSDTNAASNTVAENAVNGTTVGITAYATDADGTNNTITYSLSDDAAGRFTINASTGVVTVANGSLLNYEAATSHAITVVATSLDGSSNSQVMTINLSDVDEFDVGAVSDTNAAANTVAENAVNGTTVGITAYATDADGTNNTITYSLSDDAAGRFTINASTGVVTVANGSLLNYEAATSHAITVLATSLDSSSSSQVMTITLSDVDEFDVGSVSDTNAAANTVAENATNGTVVGITAYATDADGTNNTITYSLSDNAGGRFAINASTGVVTVANGTLLDYEAATSHAITVVATSLDGSSSQVMSINLSDVDEFDVGAVSDTNAGANNVVENATNGTVVGITAYATDADGTNNTITYSLSDTAGGRFTINASTGVVTVADGTLLNFEAATSHAITVVATSLDGSSNSQVMTINLSDVDEFDVGAVSDTNAAANTVAENAANGTTVGITAYATDADGTNNTITYSLSDDAAGRFTVNASTGVVTVANGSLLNYEAATSHAITVLATSTDGSSSNQVMTITLSDVNEFPVGAITDTNAAADIVAENAANGTLVGITAQASDADATTSAVTYSLSNNAGGRFTINASTGVVSVANGTLLDVEAASSHTITVLATSADASTSSQSFVIALSPLNDNAPVITSGGGGASAALSVMENTTAVGVITATDADTGSSLAYSIVGGSDAGLFRVDPATGSLTFIAAPDRENPTDLDGDNVYHVVLQVSDGALTDAQSIAITVANANDAPVLVASAGQATARPDASWAAADLTSAFTDQDGDALSLVIRAQANHGTVTILADGTVRYQAAAGFQGMDRFGYTVSDGQAQGTVRFVDITVQQATSPAGPIMQPPAAIGTPQQPDPTPEPSEPEAEETPPVEAGPATPDTVSTEPLNPPTEERSLEVTADTAGPHGGPAGSSTASSSSVGTGYAFRMNMRNMDFSMSPGQALFKMMEGWKVEVMPVTQGINLSLSSVAVNGQARAAPIQFSETSDDQLVQIQKTVIQGSSAVMSVGAVWWAARMSGLVASLIVSTPAWRSFDPLPVRGFDDDDDHPDQAPGDNGTAPDNERHMDEKAAGLFGPRATADAADIG